MEKDDYLKLALVTALIATGVTSACIPSWSGSTMIISGIFALLNFHPKN